MYQAFYRKWRPRSFDDVAGQEHVTETLRSQVASGRLSHAYLFVGTRGTGKTSCAKILARAVNCERLSGQNGNPCNECPACRGIEDGSVLDVLELDAASNNGVDNVRALRDEAVYSPAVTRKRVYIIDEVHMLTAAAFNALLKILEEPPEHLLFILATTELHKVPATILSRCQRFSFKRLTPDIIAARLLHVAGREGLTLSAEAAGKLSRLADGSMRDALSLLDQCASAEEISLKHVLETLGLAGNDELFTIVRAVLSRDLTAALSAVDTLYAEGKDLSALLDEMAALFRDALVYKLSKNSALLSGAFDAPLFAPAADKTEHERLFYCLDTIRDTALSMTRGGGGTRLAAELCVIKMCDERLFVQSGSAALLSRISRLESLCGETGAGAALTPEEPVRNNPADALEEELPPWADDSQAPEPVRTEDLHDMQTAEAVPPESPPEPSGTGFWDEILALLKHDIAAFSLLSDTKQVAAELDGAVLKITVGSAFTANAVESQMVMAPLRAAAQKALGQEVTVKVAQRGEKPEDKSGKLERLAAFNNITFE